MITSSRRASVSEYALVLDGSDMPQPLSKVRPNASLFMGNVGASIFNERPGLAILALECIAEWSHVEAMMLHMFMDLAGGDQEDAAAIYLALEIQSAKLKAITVLSERRLSQDHQNLLKAILKHSKTLQKQRDKLAHWSWGISPNLPDALLLSDPRNLRAANDAIFVYTEADFTDMKKAFGKLGWFGKKFSYLVTGRYRGTPREPQLYDQLCKEPEVAETLRRQAQQG